MGFIAVRDVLSHDAPGRQAERLIDASHPIAVAFGEVIIHRHDMYALIRKSVEVNREGRCERLTLAGFHFSDLSMVQSDAAEHLDIVVPLADHPARHLAHDRIGFRQDIIECLTSASWRTQTLLKFLRLALECIIRKSL